jgi:hypothetical protein
MPDAYSNEEAVANWSVRRQIIGVRLFRKLEFHDNVRLILPHIKRPGCASDPKFEAPSFDIRRLLCTILFRNDSNRKLHETVIVHAILRSVVNPVII